MDGGGTKRKKIRKQVTILEAHPGPEDDPRVLCVMGAGDTVGACPRLPSLPPSPCCGLTVRVGPPSPGVRGGSWWSQQHTAECSGLTYLTLQLRTRSQGFYSNNWGAGPASNRAVATTEQRGGPTQHYSASSGQHSTKHTLHQGRITASTCWGKMRQASIPNTALTSKLLDSHSLYQNTPIGKQHFKITVDNCSS